MSWLTHHLERFVKPRLGYVPEPTYPTNWLTADDMSVIKNAWRSTKAFAKGRTIVLPGRDVWVFEVLARRENYPTVFLPQCSRLTVKHMKIPLHKYVVLDTGFIGSIPKGLGCVDYLLLSSAIEQGSRQVFPTKQGSRNLALRIENLPKYWETGRIAEGQVIQIFSNDAQFAQAALLTQAIYKDSSPRFVQHLKKSRLSFRQAMGIYSHDHLAI